eukprot:TRINITY_DN5576_c0_g1_i1.p1 TRINITY_DN5576_c0_g1~~TRINITY_DN5576_c0_g1_i1.p1  ORF type:complete len:436 (+),score=18.19 TRINITY_DN5576_c0_g1_i1:57-1364(+)
MAKETVDQTNVQQYSIQYPQQQNQYAPPQYLPEYVHSYTPNQPPFPYQQQLPIQYVHQQPHVVPALPNGSQVPPTQIMNNHFTTSPAQIALTSAQSVPPTQQMAPPPIQVVVVEPVSPPEVKVMVIEKSDKQYAKDHVDNELSRLGEQYPVRWCIPFTIPCRLPWWANYPVEHHITCSDNVCCMMDMCIRVPIFLLCLPASAFTSIFSIFLYWIFTILSFCCKCGRGLADWIFPRGVLNLCGAYNWACGGCHWNDSNAGSCPNCDCGHNSCSGSHRTDCCCDGGCGFGQGTCDPCCPLKDCHVGCSGCDAIKQDCGAGGNSCVHGHGCGGTSCNNGCDLRNINCGNCGSCHDCHCDCHCGQACGDCCRGCHGFDCGCCHGCNDCGNCASCNGCSDSCNCHGCGDCCNCGNCDCNCGNCDCNCGNCNCDCGGGCNC